jgi:hypothetical protein
VQLPALTLTVDDILAAVSRAGGQTRAGLVAVEPDAGLMKLLDGIPAAYATSRARRLGFPSPPDIDGVIAEYRAANRS